MKPTTMMTTTLGVLLVGFSLTASATMTRDAYRQQREAISQRFDASLAECDGLQRNARAVCMKQAEADRDMHYADLESAYRNTTEANLAAARAKVEALYGVDRETCDDLAGRRKRDCLRDAATTRDRALMEIEANTARYEVRQAALISRVIRPESDDEQALARCQALAEHAREVCHAEPGCLSIADAPALTPGGC